MSRVCACMYERNEIEPTRLSSQKHSAGQAEIAVEPRAVEGADGSRGASTEVFMTSVGRSCSLRDVPGMPKPPPIWLCVDHEAVGLGDASHRLHAQARRVWRGS